MQALHLAQKLNARSKESDSYSMLAKLYFRKGDYKNAYDYQQKWYTIDTSLVNAGTNEAIAGLQERFNAKQREQDNKLLQAQIEKAKIPQQGHHITGHSGGCYSHYHSTSADTEADGQ